MFLSTPVTSPLLDVTSTAPTVVAPGEVIQVEIVLQPHRPCAVGDVAWEVPDALGPVHFQSESGFPLRLEEGQPFEMEYTFLPETEGFGEMHATLEVRPLEGEPLTVRWSAWISVFERRDATEEGLSDALRRRLIQVVNARARNGHIFLADYASFFPDFLNVTLPERIAGMLAEEFGLPSQHLPLDPERYRLILLGYLRFYGIDRLELIAEEDCDESDDRFDVDAAREVSYDLDIPL